MLVLRTRLSVSSFNSRTLGRVRLQRCRNLDLLVCFNSRTLGRVRRNAGKMSHKLNQFQFTHPGKGATHEDEDVNPHQWFQFTHPGKGATRNVNKTNENGNVSIHAPWEGCDDIAVLLCVISERVSIHAPWEGCDPVSSAEESRPRSFNSRTLGRVRLFIHRSDLGGQTFQFTHPGKGATLQTEFSQNVLAVSIHAPWEGCDSSPRTSVLWLICFNSRTLGRVRLNIIGEAIKADLFQFTHPGKGATVWCKGAYYRADKQA